MACANVRDVQQSVEPVKGIINSLPWAQESLPKIDQFSLSDDIKTGFKKVVEIESGGSASKIRSTQLAHLMDIAKHEQGVVLQRLIYDDENFSKWTKRQREWYLLNLISPAYEIVFSDKCSGKDEMLLNEAPDDMIVEDYSSRMDWITAVAEQFHDLMESHTSYMHQTIRQIATWDNAPDARFVY